MNLNFIGPINSLGYGVAGFNFFRCLVDAGHNLSYWPPRGTTDDISLPQDYVPKLQEAINNVQLFDPHAPCLRIWHQFDMAMHVGKGRFFGMPIFELDTFTKVEKHHLTQLDNLLVNSQWAADVVKDQLEYPPQTDVIPLGVDRNIFKPAHKRNTDKTIFLNVGKWEIRKGHDILLDAFLSAFRPDDDVELWLMCENPFYDAAKNKEWTDYYKNSKLGSKIKVLNRQHTQQDVAHMMNMADVGVFPSRGEGWNLDLLEMMSCGKQVIATNYSAHTEFCNAENCSLIEVNEKEPAVDGVWFNGQGNWAKIGEAQLAQLSSAMRNMHEFKKKAGNLLENEAGIRTAEEYSWENATTKLVDVLNLWSCTQ